MDLLELYFFRNPNKHNIKIAKAYEVRTG